MIFLSPECKAACRDCIKGGAMEGDEHFLVKATAVLPSHFSVWVAPSLLEPRAQQSGVQGEWEQWALPHRKDWWWVLWGRSQEILSVDISAFELLIILQLGKRKLVLLLHMFFVSGVYDMLNMLSCMLWELWQRIQPEDVVSSPILWSALLRSVIPQVRSTTNKPWGLLDLSYTEFFSFFYATVSFFTPCSSAASEQAQGISGQAPRFRCDLRWHICRYLHFWLPYSCLSGQGTPYAREESSHLCAGDVKPITELLLQLLTEDRILLIRTYIPGTWAGIFRECSDISMQHHSVPQKRT